MQALTSLMLQRWAESHGYALDERGLPALRSATDLERFPIPSDSGGRVALVRRHLRAFQSEAEVCVWLHDWDVWPSGQWHHLFQRFRLSYGISESLDECPGFVIPTASFDAATSAVVYAVLMLWDCHVLGSSGRLFLFYSHDEFGNRRT